MSIAYTILRNPFLICVSSNERCRLALVRRTLRPAQRGDCFANYVDDVLNTQI